MPRGRPRKVKAEEATVPIETTEKIMTTEEGKKPAQDETKNIPATEKDGTKDVTKNMGKDTKSVCQCCGKKIDSSVRTLNLTYLTSIAPYRFEVENENGLIKVCSECALELGKVIEAWMLEKGAKRKWSDL